MVSTTPICRGDNQASQAFSGMGLPYTTLSADENNPAASNAVALPGGNGIFAPTPTVRITHYTCAKGCPCKPAWEGHSCAVFLSRQKTGYQLTADSPSFVITFRLPTAQSEYSSILFYGESAMGTIFLLSASSVFVYCTWKVTSTLPFVKIASKPAGSSMWPSRV